MTTKSRDALQFPSADAEVLGPYLPDHGPRKLGDRPFVTLTFATSLDSSISIAPGVPTALSGPESKSMTHYLRSRHDAILIGVGTALADNPSLNCRIQGVGGYGGHGLQGQPRPVVLDPNSRWDFSADSKVLALARQGRGKAPIILSWCNPPPAKQALLQEMGGKYITFKETQADSFTGRLQWPSIFEALGKEGIRSVMIEGGGTVINDLLHPRFFHALDAIIVTIAPTWLGKHGVHISPDERLNEGGLRVPTGRLKDVKWYPLGEDVVLCGRPQR